MDLIIESLDKNLCAILIALDFSKAFDKVIHSLMCAKLRFYGFDDNSVSFFESYLSNRSQRVIFHGETSSLSRVTSGVPQRSILGQILFLIYTAEMYSVVAGSHVQGYADDTCILHTTDLTNLQYTQEMVNRDLSALTVYAEHHGLSLNGKKSCAMVLCSRRKRTMVESNLRFNVGGDELVFSERVLLLGLHIDVDLRFRYHVGQLFQKTYAKIKILYANKHILDVNLKKRLTESFVLSQFNYALVSYYFCLDLMTENRIQKVQNICCRFSLGLRKYDRVSAKIKELGWLKMEYLARVHFLVMVHKILISSVPFYLRQKLVCRSDLHSVNVRNGNLLALPMHFTALYRRCFTYNAVKLYNSIDPGFKKMSVLVFKKRLKLYYFNCIT